MAMIRPTLLLKMELKPAQATEDMRAEVSRAYSHIAPSSMIAAADDAADDIMHFKVLIRSPYWNDADEGATEQWNEVMHKWLHNMFYKVSHNMAAFNKVKREAGEATLDFDRMDVELEPFTVSIHLDADSAIPESALDMVETLRARCNDGAVTGDITCVSMPSRASYEAQAAAALEAARAAAAEADDDGEAPEITDAPFDIDYSVWGIEYADGHVEEYTA